MSFGQKDCGFKIDEEKILKNENLDFFLDKLKNEKFDITNRKEDIPKQILKQLEYINGEFTIANPNEKYQDSDLIEDNKLPNRGLIFFAKNKNTLIIYYAMSIGPGITSRLLFIEYDSAKIKDFWCGNIFGKANVKNLENIYGLVNRQRDATYPMGLQSNVIIF